MIASSRLSLRRAAEMLRELERPRLARPGASGGSLSSGLVVSFSAWRMTKTVVVEAALTSQNAERDDEDAGQRGDPDRRQQWSASQVSRIPCACA